MFFHLLFMIYVPSVRQSVDILFLCLLNRSSLVKASLAAADDYYYFLFQLHGTFYYVFSIHVLVAVVIIIIYYRLSDDHWAHCLRLCGILKMGGGQKKKKQLCCCETTTGILINMLYA